MTEDKEKKERRCIALGRGPKAEPHYYFADIDTKDVDLGRIKKDAPDALIVESHRGYHVLNFEMYAAEYILSVCDPLCPGNAVRVIPNDDLKLIQRPTHLCLKVCKIYEAMFNMPTLPTVKYDDCRVPLKPGIYVAAKDGIKLTGQERHLS